MGKTGPWCKDRMNETVMGWGQDMPPLLIPQNLRYFVDIYNLPIYIFLGVSWVYKGIKILYFSWIFIAGEGSGPI